MDMQMFTYGVPFPEPKHRDWHIVNVLWFSRHDPTNEQMKGLYDYICLDRMPDVDTSQIKVFKADKTVENGAEIRQAMKDANAAYVVAVAPTEILAEFWDAALKEFGPIFHGHLLLPRSKRERVGDEVKFVYDGFDMVTELAYKCHKVGFELG